MSGKSARIPTDKPQKVVQTSITMQRDLKLKYSRLAVTLDLSFSQLVRHALGKVYDEHADNKSK